MGVLDFSNTNSGGQDNFFQLLFNEVIVIDMKEGSATLLPLNLISYPAQNSGISPVGFSWNLRRDLLPGR